MKRLVAFLLALVASLAFAGCSGSSTQTPSDTSVQRFSATGYVEMLDNLRNETIVSHDPNVFKAEYDAGFLQGRQQRDLLPSARDNSWDTAYLVDPTHSFPRQIPPSAGELATTRDLLLANYAYTLDYIRRTSDPALRVKMTRLIYRMLGLYHGATREAPAPLSFRGDWLPDLSTFSPEELALGYETAGFTFADLYFLNGFSDVMDVIAYNHGGNVPGQPDKCSAFVKKTADDLYITHNSWYGFLSQGQAFNLFVNDTFMTFNALGPGLVASSTDFGYNKQGILFNETTHLNSYSEPKVEALWMFFRAALAEQFAGSLDEFYEYVSLEASGTYCNGYMVIDAKTGEYGLVEMSYKSFVYLKSDGHGGYVVTTKPDGISKAYDPELVQADCILGINFPASYQIREDLQSVDNRPARRVQFLAGIGQVQDMETSKDLITYTDPANPLSIYGRWDLGYGVTPKPKKVPDGSVDAKAISASVARQAMSLRGVLDLSSPHKSFWMKFGTPYVNGLPFIWSQSDWAGQKLRDVPDRVDGDFHYLNLYIR